MLKSFAAIFLKPEDETGETSGEAKTLPPSDRPLTAPASPVLPPAGQMDPAAESKFTERLGKAIEEGNATGIDFYEFMKSLEALTPLIPDEVTRYKAALGSLMAQGAKGEYILQTAQHYLDLLDEKERSFRDYAAQHTEEVVTKKNATADGIREQIKAKSDQINALAAEIASLTQNEMVTRNEATFAKAEIEATQHTFESVKARYVTMITSTRDKLAQYGLNKPQS